MANAIQGSSVHAVVLGFAKAFEKFPHRRLLRKLQYYGIHGPPLKWLESFLTQCSQLVVWDGQSSCPSERNFWCTTGYSPRLFLVYINDSPDNVQSSVRVFTDDALLYGVVACAADCDLSRSDLSNLKLK